MKKKKLLLLIVPVFMLLYSLAFRYSLGPFYYNIGYDPSYVYLINSLNIAQFKSPQHVDHPGTPLQTAGALILKSVYFFSGNSGDISKDVLTDPERYLKVIYLILIISSAAVLLFCGLMVCRSSGSALTAVLIQLSVFSSFTTSFELTSVTAEIMLIPLTMLLITYSILYAMSVKRSKYIMFFSLICGIAIATKLSFFPMAVIPFLIIKGVIRKIIFILLTIFVFVVSILPAISNYDYFTVWINGLITHEGVYGLGEKNILNTSAFFENLLTVFQTEIIFTVSFFLTAVVIILVIVRYKIITGEEYYREKFFLLVSFFIAASFQLLIVAKHYSPRYMIPALMLSVPAIYLCFDFLFQIFRTKFPQSKKLRSKYIPVFLIIVILTMTSIQFYIRYLRYTEYRKQIDELNQIIEDHPSGKIVISSYGTSRKEYALVFALYYSGEMNSKYKALILEMYPDGLYFDYFNKVIFSLQPEYDPDIFRINKTFLFLNSFPLTNQDFINDLRESYSAEVLEFNPLYTTSSGEALYEVKIRN